MASDMHQRYFSYKCWMCRYYERGADELLPPPADERRHCNKLSKFPNAHNRICPQGRADEERMRLFQQSKKKGPAASLTVAADAKSPIERAIEATNPSARYYISLKKARLSSSEIEELVAKGVIHRYTRSGGYEMLRLAGPYHNRVKKQ